MVRADLVVPGLSGGGEVRPARAAVKARHVSACRRDVLILLTEHASGLNWRVAGDGRSRGGAVLVAHGWPLTRCLAAHEVAVLQEHRQGKA